MWFKTLYHLLAKKKRNDGGCDSKHDYHLQSKEKINGVRKDGEYDSKHDITYELRK